MLVNSQGTPQLNTDFSEPLQFLENLFLKKRQLIHDWFEKQWQLSKPPVYGSVDLRNAGFKLAPIDMNLFPAGFNNLNKDHLSLSVNAAKKVILDALATTKNILLIPESHTRNLFYWENIKTLQDILLKADFRVRLGILDEDVVAPKEIILAEGGKLTIEPIIRKEDCLFVADFAADLVLLNNDLAEGIPKILQHLKCPLLPPPELGWSQRLKSDHFHYYAEVTQEFAQALEIDPWLLAPLFRYCEAVDFMQQEGLDCIISNAEILFAAIQKKYAEFGIPYQPFLIVKADAGTYGMAVMTIRSIEELRNLNRKQRTRMATTKGGQTVRRVIIQEGIYTFETLGPEQAVAEPVVYLWGSSVVGGFYRVHKERGIDENLNAPGMHFEPLAFSQNCQEPCEEAEPHACQNRFYIYGIVAQLSMLAAAREIKKVA